MLQVLEDTLVIGQPSFKGTTYGTQWEQTYMVLSGNTQHVHVSKAGTHTPGTLLLRTQ
jgi:hypothetical protein